MKCNFDQHHFYRLKNKWCSESVYRATFSHSSKFIFKIVFILYLSLVTAFAQEDEINTFTIVRIKYSGGGDWYGNRTTFVNLFRYISEELNIKTTLREKTYSIMDKTFFNYPIAYIAGHGNVRFSENEAIRLRKYLTSGGFLFADDDYGMDQYFRREMKKVFPELDFVEIPFNHPIYHIHHQFPNGLPKIHEHDGGPPIGLGLFYQDRLVVFYTVNTDISDGCEDPEIHNDPPEKRLEALKMGLNILLYGLLY